MIAWFIAFVATCAIELVAIRLLVRQPRALPIGFVAQCATHPFVWLAMATLPGSQLWRLACVELWATLVEAAIYKRFLRLPGREAFAVSALANAASLLLVGLAAMLAQ